MTTILDKLREAAEKATPGPWKFNAGLYTDARIWVERLDCGFFVKAEDKTLHGAVSDLAQYIALANPRTILALLESHAVLREALEFLHEYTLTDAEGPELRAQNERCYRKAREALAKSDALLAEVEK